MVVDGLCNLWRCAAFHPALEGLADRLGEGGTEAPEPGFYCLDKEGLRPEAQARPGGWRTISDTYECVLILQGEQAFRWLSAESEDASDKPSMQTPQGLQEFPAMWENALQLQSGHFALFFPGERYQIGKSGQGKMAVVRVPIPAAAPFPPQESALKHRGTQVLKTPRLTLRAYREADADAMFRNWAGDPEVTRTLKWEPHPDAGFSRELIRGWVKAYRSGQSYHWVILWEDEPIGDIAVMRWSARDLDCEIGYCLSRGYWNRGVMSEALTAVMRFLFDEVNFRKITLRHDVQNPASGRVMQKAGLVCEGRQRQALKRRDGSYADILLYAALRDEWPKVSEDNR